MANQDIEHFKAGDWQISADNLNRMVDEIRKGNIGPDTIQDGIGTYHHVRTKQSSHILPLIRIINQTGLNLPQFSVVGIGEGKDSNNFDIAAPCFYTASQNPDAFDEFRHFPTFPGVVPDIDVHSNRLAITLENSVADSNEETLALIIGAAPVKIKVDSGEEDYQFAAVATGHTDYLKAAEAGPARIIWKESGTGIKQAVVYLAGGGSESKVGLKPFRLLEELSPCGYALACDLDLTYDPPKPDYENTFTVKDFMRLRGLEGWVGWADPRSLNQDDSNSDDLGSGSSDAIYPIVNIGPPCHGSSSSGEGSSGEDSSEGGSSGEGSSGEGSSGEGSQGSASASESGSEKNPAIVPASWTLGGFTEMYTLEFDRVYFGHTLKLAVEKGYRAIPIDPRHLEICERGTFEAYGPSANKPVAVAAHVEGESLIIETSDPSKDVVVTVILLGIRRGMKHLHFRDVTKEEFKANENFLRMRLPNEQ